ncbi:MULTISPECIES: glutamine synthetase family protein [unclassified Bradyrhizobium]|uniref:glutamine synthetase family protein n=1 Tax=unclassified Bradyrhizobium TaxID=2631580 RepID=UPI00247A792E|nr:MULTISPECIES: glutamine synthetase family protein [unclassified Bradyrhizobium]WGS19272.1 glutamine synthetase family protein [Bradyrhizobium sp. ISRA463]WGS26106.1 glutamine synthetase family protein [Bradyrhizobium sp. ISRA464]
MIAEEMVIACCTDLAGKVRGKAFPASQFEARRKRGIGWTPTNVQITCFDTIAESPFGSLGDLVLLPDEAARVRVQLDDDMPAEHFALGDIRHTDGRPWEFCTRSLLKAALERLNRVSGLALFGAFEHEFQFRNATKLIGEAYSVNGFRIERRLAETLVAAMRAAGLEPDTFMKEFGAGQYEITMGPSRGVAIADQSTIIRELVHLVASASGKEATFTPIRDPASVGNGVHIHISFLKGDEPATWDPSGKHELSKVAGQFIAGILKYLDAIVAMTAPSVVSYLRLTPHRWSAAFNNLGFRDREASVRICPVSDLSDISKSAQFNFEFRAADATASPHLQLAAIVHAGVQGIEEELPTPDATAEDLSLLDPSALAARQLVRLPKSLPEALDRLLANQTVNRWFPAGFVDTYAKHKNGEMAFLEGKTQQEICSLYEQVY